jgi:bifunctional non-homologous end joining protein LigD
LLSSINALVRARSPWAASLSRRSNEIGPDLFRAACGMGLEGLVSKRRDRAYRGGRCNHWIKIKNPDSPAMKRGAEVDWSRR